jgi:serine/threonine protein kinase
MDNSFNENIDEKDSFLKQNQILFKKYHPIKEIGKGTFSTVYASINIKTRAFVAIKVEKRGKDNIELLESEAFLLHSLRGFGIPEVLSYGRTKTHNILVLPLLGKSLLDMFILNNSAINFNDICGIAIQILDRIEWVHSNNIVYRDIKPENFLFGKKDNDVLYLIDFGLCRKYKSSRTGKHIKPKCLGKFTGTSRYASVYAMAGNEQSRRDDIESIGYMIIFFMKKRLPWQGIKGRTYKECYHKLFLMKKYMKIEELCKGLPREIIEYMNIAKAMKFEQEPDYNYLKNLFKSILKKNNVILDKYIYSWCRQEILNNKDYTTKDNDNIIERKTSPQNRLYKKIQEITEKKNKYIPSTNIRQISANDKSKNITINSYDNSMKNKMGINSELSNTMKVMINKNINSINSGSIEPTGVNLPRINSDKNIYKDNFISFRGNSQIKKHYSPDNKKNLFFSLKEDNNNKNNNSLLKKGNMQKDGNLNKKIISVSPISNSKYIKVNNNMINNEGTNNKKNHLIKKSKIIPNNENKNLKNTNT